MEVSPALIRQVHATLNGSPQKGRRHSSLLSDQEVDNTDYIISLEDRKKFKLFETPSVDHYGLTQDEYRAKWGLPADYPMVAPSYAAAPGFGQDDGAWPQTKRAGNAVPSKRTQRRSQLDFVYRRFVLKRPVANGMIARNMRGGR
ncbi:transcriptional regulatory protein [Mesorhizobium amorphae CCNWGS0123]|uniref:Transcriptional regulatory protein n=1 Tax=Mesorhizobium amorphae CCNWGS0123 TaxID=1082933 RepID=G6Y5R7_9HYPH|nr:transcriptional regulatory protein [Mesorhizobium amorphae CCNWGS0123]